MNLDNLITPPEERRNDPKAGNAEKLQSIGRTAERIMEAKKPNARNLAKPKKEKAKKGNHAQSRKPKQGTTTPKAKPPFLPMQSRKQGSKAASYKAK